jgi:hypothetical protein
MEAVRASSGRRLATYLLLLALLVCTPAAWSYYEDITTTPSGSHSTFHYELTRTLARAVGFSFDDAEWIAVTAEAVDVGTFQGEFSTSPTIQLQGTGRFGAPHLYYHFARRGPTNVTGAYTYPGGRNTCDYFAGTSDPCTDGPEVNSLELWAVSNSGTLTGSTPKISVNGSALAPVAAPSLSAVAIYVHALADSYSHEACMKATDTRGHSNSPPVCEIHYWHLEAEYGPDPSRDKGTSYTQEAGRAMWLALKWFRQQNGLNTAPRWSDQSAADFIDQWATLDGEQDRRNQAINTLYSLTLPPDMNCDDSVTASDLTTLASLIVTGEASRCGADPNGDHIIDNADVEATLTALFEAQ